MTLEPFRVGHLNEIRLHPSQADWHTYGSRNYAEQLAGYRSYTARTDRIVACFGIVPWSADVGHLWTFIAERAPMMRLHRTALRLFETAQPRLLANTPCGSATCRWLEMLGFKYHDTLPGFGPDGRDHMLYLRIA